MTYAVQEATFRTPGGNAAVMAYRADTNDWNTLASCMTEDEYGLRDRRVSGTAVDVGAYLGGVAIGLALDNPDLKVIALEPVPWNAELTRENVRRNDLTERVTVVEAPAGDGGPVSINFGYSGSVSALHHAFVGNSSILGGEPHETLRYPESVTLTELLDDAGSIDLLKIDCEGGEWAFLDDPNTARVPLILGEWHPTDGKTIGDLIALLPEHVVTFSGPQSGPGGFVAVAK